MKSRPLRGLLVDYAGVLTGPIRDAALRWIEADALDAAKVEAFFAELVLQSHSALEGPMWGLEVGAWTPQQFEIRIAADLAAAGVGTVSSEGLLHRMFGGVVPDREMIELVARIRAAGIRTGLLSNSFGLEYPREEWPRLFDVTVISHEVRMRKPDPAIFELALDRLGLAAAETVFVDDFPENVAAAEALGMVGILHRDVASTGAQLARMLNLPTIGAAPGEEGQIA